MEWSGRAPAPPASEAGKGRQRRGARHVTQVQFWDRRDWYRYRQELVSHRGLRETRCNRAAAEGSRGQVEKRLANLRSCLIGMEACVGAEIEVLARRDAGCERLMSVPGIGPIISSAMVAAIGTGDAF